MGNTKNTKNGTKNNKNTAAVKRGPGRPKASLKWPRGRFTKQDAFALNGNVSHLTVIKAMDRDMYMVDKTGKPNRQQLRRNSLIVKLPELREPDNAEGLGRKREVFILREVLAAQNAKKGNKATSTKRTSKASTGTDYEAQKAALLNDTAVPMTPAPVADPAPVAEAPAPAPVVSEPAPAPVADPAPVTA